VSTAAPTSLSLAGPRPLQTFVAPTEACPIPLSILWMPISFDLFLSPGQQEIPERVVDIVWQKVFTERTKSNNPRNAIRYFFASTAACEQRLISALFKTTKEPPIDLLRYAVLLHDWQSEQIEIAAADLLETNVVINRSPPREEVLEKLLSTGVLGFGTYAGMSIVPEQANPILLLACISGGIICISTASGIGRALQDGIYARLVSWISGTDPLFRGTPVRRKGKGK
jgi:hypothetical protein